MADTKTEAPKASKMEELLSSSDQPMLPKVNDVVKANVISVSSNEAHLDIDGLTTGVVRGRELTDESGTYSNLKVGDIVEATVLEMENENGEMELSFRQAGHQKAWDSLDKLMKEGNVVGVTVTEANKGGLMVQVGRIDGFLPVSQLTVEHYPRVEGGEKSKILEKLTQFIGQELKVKIIDVDEADSKLIVSEKAAWEEKQQEKISEYTVGDIIEGRVTGVVDFGAFIEFGKNLEGLVHISELAWQRIDDPRDYIKVGDMVKARIISIDGSKISLSIKALKEDPWKNALERYHVGQVIRGRVIKMNHFGVFVELDEDIHGLAHISELSDRRISDPSEIVKMGEPYKFKILSIEPENHRLGLSMKAVNASAKAAKKPDEGAPEPDQTPEQTSESQTSVEEAPQA
ncbi:MAG: S1 RNA-binding domain-containing protein [Patescibacteria group bacterium]|nr:S1 RNA-binding domain-containing protein [Patescibacteria group bacterium]MDD5715529.1 S1 RNA-binding domain-containing protein [Patescibacteria group bacterium]